MDWVIYPLIHFIQYKFWYSPHTAQHIIVTYQWSCEKVIFSFVSVSSHWGESPCGRYPSCIGPHSTGFLGPTPGLHIWETSSGHHWRPVWNCSLDNHLQYWYLVATKTCTVAKQVEHILLEWFLISFYNLLKRFLLKVTMMDICGKSVLVFLCAHVAVVQRVDGKVIYSSVKLYENKPDF